MSSLKERQPITQDTPTPQTTSVGYASHISRTSTFPETTAISIEQQTQVAHRQELTKRDIVIAIFTIIFLLTGFTLFLVYRDTGLASSMKSLLHWFSHVKWEGLIILVLIYVIAMIFIIPIKSVLALAFGLFYGLPLGLFLTYVSAVIGMILAFLLGRYVCAGLMERFIYVFCINRFKSNEDSDIDKYDKFTRYTELFNYLCMNDGFKTVLMIRFSFFPPSEWTNYIFANTLVSFKDFTFASFVGRLFATASVYVYIGSTLKNIVDIVNGDYDNTFWIQFTIITVLYVFFFVLLYILTRKARQWIKGREEMFQAHKKLKSMNTLIMPSSTPELD